MQKYITKYSLIFLLTFLVYGCVHNEKKKESDKEKALANQEVVEKTPNADDVIARAKRYIGRPYYYGGTTYKTGFDCSGFVNYVYKKVYGKSPLPRTSYEMARIGTTIYKKDLQKGDLVFFNTLNRPYSHVGIYIGDRKFIHSSTSKGVIISSVDDPYYYKARYQKAKRIDIDKLLEKE